MLKLSNYNLVHITLKYFFIHIYMIKILEKYTEHSFIYILSLDDRIRQKQKVKCVLLSMRE
jgi:hypothetical protein